MLKSTLPLLLALSFPVAANAGALVETRHAPEGARCAGDGGKKGPKTLEKWGAALGGAETRKAWKELIGAGKPGCDAIAAWLVAGAAGEEGAGVADIVDVLIQNGDPGLIEAALSQIGHPDEAVMRRILKGLEYRLAVVDEATTTVIVQDTRPGVANDALAVFIGYHARGTMKSVYGVPVYEEIEYWGPVNPPPAHYVEAVRSILSTAGPDEMKSAAKYAGRHFRENNPGQDVWAAFLAPMVTPPSSAEQKAANTAALHLAWGEAPGIDEVIAAVIAGGNAEVNEHLVDGFEKRLDAGRGDAGTIARLQTIAASASPEAKRAGQIAKKFEKKMK